MSIKKENLYLLPWTLSNCPNGWIEPTTFCQLQCPECYRGCDRVDHMPVHRGLSDMKKEIECFIKDRNVQTISIAGGEPLFYPELNELIEFIKNRGLKVMIFTNGLLLNKEKLLELKKLGVNQIVLHIDKYQNRQDVTKNEEVNLLKEKYCDLFREIKDISLGFISSISKENFFDLESDLLFYRKNSDIVSLIDFTIYTDAFFNEDTKNKDRINAQDTYEKIKDLYGIEYCAYLEKSLDKNITWLSGTAVFSGKNFLGSVDKEVVRFVQEDYYKKNKKFLFIDNDLPISIKSIWLLLTNKSLRKIFFNFLKQKNKGKINFQVILIISPPEVIDKTFNMCNSCPDAMYYKGKLVPSCIYSRIKNGLCRDYKYYCSDYIE